MKTVLLSTAYFPPIQYFTKLVKFPTAIIEAQESFLKQSYRNRCNILGSNGKTALTIPVKKANSGLPIQSIKIDYSENWQRQHQRALLAAYSSSPFYEYYIEDFGFVFHERFDTLWELNQQILATCCNLLEITPEIIINEEFIASHANDFRTKIHPKENHSGIDQYFHAIPYTQVFSDKFAFEPNLSILDLLFNLGTESEIYLLSTIQQEV